MAYQFVREPLKPEDADKLANACETLQEKLIVWTLLDTGLRVSELCSLTLENIQWQNRQLRIKGKGGPYGSMSKQRVVPISTRVRAVLEAHFAVSNSFPVQPRRVQQIVKMVAARTDIIPDITPHILRHSFAVMAIQKGISLAAVKKILGHDRISTTEIYLNLTDAHIQQEFDDKW
jgi:integrase/recombinase XerD